MKCKRCKGKGRIPMKEVALSESLAAYTWDLILGFFEKGEQTGMCPDCEGSGQVKKNK